MSAYVDASRSPSPSPGTSPSRGGVGLAHTSATSSCPATRQAQATHRVSPTLSRREEHPDGHRRCRATDGSDDLPESTRPSGHAAPTTRRKTREPAHRREIRDGHAVDKHWAKQTVMAVRRREVVRDVVSRPDQCARDNPRSRPRPPGSSQLRLGPTSQHSPQVGCPDATRHPRESGCIAVRSSLYPGSLCIR